MNQKELKEKLADWKWRLTSGYLYKIKDKNGNVIPFIPNKYQTKLINELHFKNIILKARQLGFSTMIQILMLDQALFYSNISCGVIAQGVKDAKTIFDNKIKFAYDNLPDWLKNNRKLTSNSVDMLSFDNGSSIYVSTSFRGGTLQYLHVSEYGKICAKYPEKAKEINTGALEAVGAGNYVFIESTAEGKSGDFFDKCENAMKLHKIGKILNEHEYKFFFFAWREVSEYRLFDKELTITEDTVSYFKQLEGEYGIKCDEYQMKRYQVKKEEKKDDMLREYPSTPEEAFNVAIKGSYYGDWVMRTYEDKRVCVVPYEPHLPLYTAWDLGGTGGGDNMDLWFFQIYGKEIRFVDWFTGIGYSMQDIHHQVLTPKLKERGFSYDTMFLPHDAEVQSMNDHKTRSAQLRELGYKVVTLERTLIADRINEVRDNFKYCWFDNKYCGKGLDLLKEYQRKWNESTSSFMNEAMKNEARHTADSFGYAIQAINRHLKNAGERTDEFAVYRPSLLTRKKEQHVERSQYGARRGYVSWKRS